jgi:hypothetical protein
MKKNSSLRLKLNRETLRTLGGPESEAAQGGVSLVACIPSATCPPETQSCKSLCMPNCTTSC